MSIVKLLVQMRTILRLDLGEQSDSAQAGIVIHDLKLAVSM